MKSNKWILGLLTVALVLTLAPSSFAQIQLVIANTPSAAEVATNRAIQTSDPTSVGNGITVSGELLASSNLTSTTMTIKFPGPLTSTTTNYTVNSATIAAGIPAGDPIIMTGQSGLFSAEYITTFNGPAGTITVVLQSAVANTQSGSFRISGVHMDPTGLTAPLTATVSLSSGANGYILNTTSFPIVTALPAGIASIAQGAISNPGSALAGSGTVTNGTMLYFTNGSNPAAAATIVLTEGCAFCWRTATDSSSSGTALTNGTNIRLTVNGIPAGVTLTLGAYGVSKASTKGSFTSPTVTATTSSNTTANQTTFTLTGESQSSVEQIEFVFTTNGDLSTTLTPGAITVTATLSPVGNLLDAAATPTANVLDATSAAAGYPQFTDVEVGPVTIGTITAATTTLLVPYVVSVGAYDTGIEIANTTSDPFASTGFGATATNGNLTFNIYSSNSTYNGAATPLQVSTSSTNRFGQGLDASGNLDAGSVWTGSLTSAILPAAGATIPSGGFFGYIFITCNFLDAHGVSLVYNGAGTSYGAPLLVVPPPSSSNNRSAPNGGFESLNN